MDWGNNNNSNFWSTRRNNNNPFPLTNFAPHYEVIEVNGKAGVDAFQMGPNSSIFLADTTAPIIWFVKTDGAGLKNPVPLDVSVHQDAPQVNVNDLAARLTALEEKVNAKFVAKSNSKQSKRAANADSAAAESE